MKTISLDELLLLAGQFELNVRYYYTNYLTGRSETTSVEFTFISIEDLKKRFDTVRNTITNGFYISSPGLKESFKLPYSLLFTLKISQL